MNEDMENENEKTCKPSTNDCMNKQHETILIECNMTSLNGWKCNNCSNDYVRDDSKKIMQIVRERDKQGFYITWKW